MLCAGRLVGGRVSVLVGTVVGIVVGIMVGITVGITVVTALGFTLFIAQWRTHYDVACTLKKPCKAHDITLVLDVMSSDTVANAVTNDEIQNLNDVLYHTRHHLGVGLGVLRHPGKSHGPEGRLAGESVSWWVPWLA